MLCTEATSGEDYSVRRDLDASIRVDRINLPYFREHDPDGWQLGLARWRRHEKRVGEITREVVGSWRPNIVQYNAARPLGEEIIFAVSQLGIPVVLMAHEAWVLCMRLMLMRSPHAAPCNGPGLGRCLACVYSQYDGCWGATIKMPWRVAKLGPKPAYRVLRRARAARALSGILAYSRFMADIHKRHLACPVRYQPLGVNLENQPSTWPVRPRKPLRFGFVGGFQPNKGVYDVLDAARRLQEEGHAFELNIWGPGQESGAAAVRARNLQGRAILRGTFRYDDAWIAYEGMDVAIMATTVSEPFGRVPQEAAAAGVPTIAPSIGGLTEQIRSGVDGLLFRFRDPDGLAHQMRRVLVESGLVSRLVGNLWKVVDTRTAAAGVEEFYFDILAHPRQDAVRSGNREQPTQRS